MNDKKMTTVSSSRNTFGSQEFSVIDKPGTVFARFIENTVAETSSSF